MSATPAIPHVRTSRADLLDPEIGRAVGWDFARFGVELPERYGGSAREGYLAGRAHYGRFHEPTDRFQRKVLLIRANAWMRGRIFDLKSITADFLRSIEPLHCPITRVPLTYGTGADTDWSVDRLCNEGGYVAHNVVIISTRANIAKDRKSVADMCAASQKAFMDRQLVDGLDEFQWARLACLATYAEDVPERAVMAAHPVVVLPPLHLPSGRIGMATEVLLRSQAATCAARHHNPREGLLNAMRLAEVFRGKKSRKLAERYLARLIARTCQDLKGNPAKPATFALEDAGWDEEVRRLWMRVCSELGGPGMREVSERLGFRLRLRSSEELNEEMGAESRGYLTREYLETHEADGVEHHARQRLSGR